MVRNWIGKRSFIKSRTKKTYYHSAVEAGAAIAPPDFGRLVYTISTRRAEPTTLKLAPLPLGF